MAVSELWIALALALFLLSNVKLGESDFKYVIGVVVYQGFWVSLQTFCLDSQWVASTLITLKLPCEFDCDFEHLPLCTC